MKIKIVDWRRNGLLFTQHQLPYTNHQEIEGDLNKVAELIKDFMMAGLNVMSYHVPSTSSVVLAVDTFRFQQYKTFE